MGLYTMTIDTEWGKEISYSVLLIKHFCDNQINMDETGNARVTQRTHE
jgi:hypothetical protein